MSDSAVATYEHRQHVQELLNAMITRLMHRGQVHDQSKLEEPEKSAFDVATPKLHTLVYGSAEYKQALAELQPALKHHYAVNRHHPEYHANGIDGMTLVDLLEMLCDWKAATLRHDTGDIMQSIEINQKRFGYSDELKQIFINTIREL